MTATPAIALPASSTGCTSAFVRHFGVDAQQRLGAGQPEQQPAVVDEEAPAVDAIAAQDGPPGDFGRVRGIEDRLDRRVRAGLQVEVEPLVEVLSGDGEDVARSSSEGRLPGRGHVVEEEEPGEDAVALRQVPAEAVAAALFAADQRVLLHHQRADVLEADGRLDARRRRSASPAWRAMFVVVTDFTTGPRSPRSPSR